MFFFMVITPYSLYSQYSIFIVSHSQEPPVTRVELSHVINCFYHNVWPPLYWSIRTRMPAEWLFQKICEGIWEHPYLLLHASWKGKFELKRYHILVILYYHFGVSRIYKQNLTIGLFSFLTLWGHNIVHKSIRAKLNVIL